MRSFIKKIEKINFGLMSPDDIRNLSVCSVETPDNYGSDGYPIEKGLMDPRLGVFDSSLKCPTCGARGGDCPGHFGSIELMRPVIHAGFADVVHKILRSTCNECGRVLLTPEEIYFYTEKVYNAMNKNENLSDILDEVYSKTKREFINKPEYFNGEIDPKYCCPHCGAPQEPVTIDEPTSIF